MVCSCEGYELGSIHVRRLNIWSLDICQAGMTFPSNYGIIWHPSCCSASAITSRLLPTARPELVWK